MCMCAWVFLRVAHKVLLDIVALLHAIVYALFVQSPGVPLGCDREPVTIGLCVVPLVLLSALAAAGVRHGRGSIPQQQQQTRRRLVERMMSFGETVLDVLVPLALPIGAVNWAPATVVTSFHRVWVRSDA